MGHPAASRAGGGGRGGLGAGRGGRRAGRDGRAAGRTRVRSFIWQRAGERRPEGGDGGPESEVRGEEGTYHNPQHDDEEDQGM